jgi:predicted outer membrane repeat protein
VIDGVTIRGGTADASGANRGGAISVLGSSLTLRNCQIVGNTSSGSGGAIAVSPDFKAPFSVTINNTVLRGNRAGEQGGAVYAEGEGTLTLRYCTVIANRAVSGGGVASSGSRVRVGSTAFLGNRAYPSSGLSSGITSANTGGGMRVDSAELMLVNAIFSGNVAGSGGGALVFNAPNDMLSVMHSTIANNRAETGLVGGIAINPPFFSLQSRVYHTIFWGNRDARTASKPIPYTPSADAIVADRPLVEFSQLGRLDGGSVVTPSAFDLRRIYMDGQFFWTGGGLSGPTTPPARGAR